MAAIVLVGSPHGLLDPTSGLAKPWGTLTPTSAKAAKVGDPGTLTPTSAKAAKVGDPGTRKPDWLTRVW
jgi:hypothetical protein